MTAKVPLSGSLVRCVADVELAKFQKPSIKSQTNYKYQIRNAVLVFVICYLFEI